MWRCPKECRLMRRCRVVVVVARSEVAVAAERGRSVTVRVGVVSCTAHFVTVVSELGTAFT